MKAIASSKTLLVFLLLVGLTVSAQPGLMQSGTAEYRASDGSMTFSYPSHWLLDDSMSTFGVILANNQETLDIVQSDDGRMPEGGLIVMVSSSAMNFLDIDEDEYAQMSAMELITALADDLVESVGSEDASYDPPKSLTMSGHEAASLTAVNGQIDADALIYVIDMGTDKAAVIAYSYQGDMGEYQRDIRSLARSLVVVPPAEPTPVAGAGSLSYDESVTGEVTDTENSVWTFEGEEGDGVTLTVTGDSTELDTELVLLDPSGEELARDDDSGTDYNPLLVAIELPASGTYTVEVNSIGGSSGQFTLLLEKAVIVPPQPIDFGDSMTGQLTQPQGDRWTFTGKKDDIVRIALTADFDNLLELHDSSDTILISDDDSGGNSNAAIAGFLLPADGEYTIFVKAYDTSTAADTPYTLTLDKITVPLPGEIAYGDVVTTVMLKTDGDRWTFQGKKGDKVGLVAIGTMLPMIELHDPDDTVLASNEDTMGQNSALIEEVTLPEDGEYAIVIQSYSGSTGQYTLFLGQVMSAEGGSSRQRGR